jgi:ABC-type dipeptide/oligopeptide/nickel transport system ATPase subunit
MEHVISGCLRQVWEISRWLCESQLGFRPGHTCENQMVTVFQDIAYSLEERVKIDAKIKEISKTFDLDPIDRLLTKIEVT